MTSWKQIFPAVAAAVVNVWVARVAPTLSVPSLVTATFTALTGHSVGASFGPATLLSTVTDSVAATSLVSGGPVAGTAENFSVGSTFAGMLATPKESMQVAFTKVDLVQTTYATAASSTGSWVTPANATGAPDGANATNTDSAAAAASGVLTLTYANQFQKTQLGITAVTLDVFWATTYQPLATGTCTVDYSLDSGSTWSSIASATTAMSYGTTPQTVSLTAVVGGVWSKLSALQVRCSLVSAASATTCSMAVDSVRLTVNATQTVLS